MSNAEARLVLTRLRATSYKVEEGLNVLVQVRGRLPDGRHIDALGEGYPRGRDTGDRAGAWWPFLVDCLRQLEGRELPGTDPAAALAAVQAVLAECEKLAAVQAEELAARDRELGIQLTGIRAAKRAVKRTVRTVLDEATFWRKPKPFQGTLLALEAALVDLLTRAFAQSPEALLGRQAAGLRPHLPLPFGEPGEPTTVFERVLSHRVIESAAFPPPPAPTYNGMASTTYHEVPYLKPLGSNGTKGHLLEREALMLGLSTVRFSKGAFLATDGKQPPLIFKWSRSPRSSAVSLALCTHKEATRMRLRRAGVPVPQGRTFAYGDFEAAKAFAARIGYPVVVKPAMGVRGIGVVANIQNEQELDQAFAQLVNSRLGKGDFIVEQHITGRDYRIVVVGDEVIAAILRDPASVEGDGEHTVAELIINKNTARRLNPHLWGRPIKYDAAARYQLQRAGLTLTSIPEAGQKVLLSSSCSLSQGGDSIDVLDELHPSIKEACVKAVKAVPGLWFCGVDFLIEDHTRPLSEQRAGICELNAHAAIGNCEYPLYGTPREVARTVMKQSVEHFGLQVNGEYADQLALRLTIRGRVTRVGYRTWMQRHALNFGLTGWVRNVDSQTVEAVLVGDAAPVTALAAAAVLGPRRARPTSVSTEHITAPSLDSFQILESAPERT